MNIAVHPVSPEEAMAWLDGELSTAEAQAVSSHIGACAECAIIAQQFRATSQSLADWSIAQAPSRIEEFVAKTAEGRKLGKPSFWIRMSFWTRRQWAFASVRAVAVLIIVSSILLLKHQQIRVAAPRTEKPTTIDNLSPQFEDAQQAYSYANPQDGLASAGVLQRQVPEGAVAAAPPPFPIKGKVMKGTIGGGGGGRAILNNPTTPAPMIARTVSLSIAVKDFTSARAALDAILARHHGYSAQLTLNTPENSARSFQSSLRIPAPELTTAIGELRGLGHVEYENQTGEEVTQQHTDLVARLKTSRETEERFRAILQERTGKIEDVLAVEEEIERVRGEIESMEAEQNALEHRVDFASVELHLSEEYRQHIDSTDGSVSNRVHNAFVAGYRNAAATILGIALFFVEYGPTLLIFLAIFGLPAFLVWRRYRRALAKA